jgi:hypothetical protein
MRSMWQRVLHDEGGFKAPLVWAAVAGSAAIAGSSAYSGAKSRSAAKKAADASIQRTDAAVARQDAAAAELAQAQETASSQAQARVSKRRKRATAGGRSIYTSPLGLGGTAQVARKSLLGE